MGKVYNKALQIWEDLDASYQRLSLDNESRREFLARITDHAKGNFLPRLVSKIEEELMADDTILETGRKLITLLNLVSANLDEILKSEIKSFKEVIGQLYSKTVDKVRDLNLTDFSFGMKIPVVLDTLDILTRYDSVGTTVLATESSTVVVDPLPMELQSAIGIAGLFSMLEFNPLYKKNPTDKYLSVVDRVSKKILREDDQKHIVFIPKGNYRKTVNGYNFYVNGSTYRAFPYGAEDGCILCHYGDVIVGLVDYEYVRS